MTQQNIYKGNHLRFNKNGYINSEQHKINSLIGIKKTQIKYPCIYCQQNITLANKSKHELACFKNPINFKKCQNCEVQIKKNQNFCSRTCNATFHNKLRPPVSVETKLKISSARRGVKSSIATRLKLIKNCQEIIIKSDGIFYQRQCIHCKNIFETIRKKKKTCSIECLRAICRKSGLKSANNRAVRSQDEIALYQLCCDFFKNVTHNTIIAEGWDADILLHDQKIAILWNGPWHYQQMPFRNHSLLQVQNRDRIKIDVLSKAGWQVIAFEDRYYTPDTAFMHLKTILSG